MTPKRQKKAFDSRCFDLAEIFLEGEPHLATLDKTNELASLIQQTIEDFIAYERNHYDGGP